MACGRCCQKRRWSCGGCRNARTTSPASQPHSRSPCRPRQELPQPRPSLRAPFPGHSTATCRQISPPAPTAPSHAPSSSIPSLQTKDSSSAIHCRCSYRLVDESLEFRGGALALTQLPGISIIFQRREVACEHHSGPGRNMPLKHHFLQRLSVGSGQESTTPRELRPRLQRGESYRPERPHRVDSLRPGVRRWMSKGPADIYVLLCECHHEFLQPRQRNCILPTAQHITPREHHPDM